MKRCEFDAPQNSVQLWQLPDGKKDVLICTGEKIETRETEDGEQTVYTYDCHGFRTSLDVTEEEILSNLAYWSAYDPAEEDLLPYKNKVIDEYTLQLIEEGVIA